MHWNLDIEKNAIKFGRSSNYQIKKIGVFTIGAVNTYKNKLKLILCGFHKKVKMYKRVFRRIVPVKNML